jgi:hypothetical protein
MIDTVPCHSYTRAASLLVAVHAAQVLIAHSACLSHCLRLSVMCPAAIEERAPSLRIGASLAL